MVRLEMTQEEANVLRNTLTEALDEVRTEIVRAEKWDLRETLKERAQVLERLSLQLGGTVRTTA